MNMSSDHAELKNHLKVYRKKLALTQEALAKKVQVSRKSINTIENGIFIPSTVLALRIAEVLECTVDDLFELI